MVNPDDNLLTAPEGVDEGSVTSTAEGSADSADSAERSTAHSARTAQAAQPGAATATSQVTHGGEESDPAPPSEVNSPEIRRAQAEGSGQELSAGEG